MSLGERRFDGAREKRGRRLGWSERWGMDGMRLTSVSAPRTKSHASFTRLVPICMKKYPTSAHVASAHRASPPPVVAKADPTRKGTVAAVSVLGRAAAIHAAMPAFLGLDDGFASGVVSSFEAFAATRADLRSAMCPLNCCQDHVAGQQKYKLFGRDDDC